MIRQAIPLDAEAVVPLMIQAMGELAEKFVNTKNTVEIHRLFKLFFELKNNQYSYQNTLVFLEDNEILGSLSAYDGSKLTELRKPFLAYLKENLLYNLNLEEETEAGEFYFDTISVNPKAQGKGIGKALIEAGIQWARQLGHRQIGLLVEQENTKAKLLYEKIGFKYSNDKIFLGSTYFHLIYDLAE